MSVVYQEQAPAWTATTDPALPWRVQTSQYTVEMADYLDAGATLGGVLWRFTHRKSGRVTRFAPEAIAFVDHILRFDPLMALAHVQAAAAGDTITFDHPAYRVTYQALHDQLKLTILLKVPLRAPNPDLVTVGTAFLTLTGGIELPTDLETWDRTGLRTGDFSTTGEVYLKDSAGNVVQFLDRVTARDSEGHPGAGDIRLATDADGTRRLYQGMSWGWLQVATFQPTTDFPEGGVEIDPTVVTTTSTAFPGANQNPHIRYTSPNVRVELYIDNNSDLACRISTDAGQTWAVPASGAIAYAGTVTSFSAKVDPSGNIQIALSEAGSIRHVRGQPDAARTSFTWSAATTLQNGGTDWGYVSPDLYPVKIGATIHLHCLYSYQENVAGSSTPRFSDVYYERRTIPDAGGAVTAVTTIQLEHQNNPSSFVDYPGEIVADGANDVHMSYGWKTDWKYAKLPGSGGTWPAAGLVKEVALAGVGPTGAVQMVLSPTGAPYIAALAKTGSVVKVATRTSGAWADISPPGTTGTAPQGFFSGTEYRVVLVSSGLKMRAYTDAGWSAVVTVDADTTIAAFNVERVAGASDIGVLFRANAAAPYAIKYVAISLNAPPTEATLTLSPGAFAAASGTQIDGAHHDTDPMGAWAVKRVNGSEILWWNNTTKAWQSAEIFNAGTGSTFTILAADNAGKWITGNIYLLYAATKDSQGLFGPYNSVAVRANVGAVPVVTITSAATTNTAEYVLEWTSDRATSAYQVRLLDAGVLVPGSDTGKAMDATARSRTVTMSTTGKVYTPEVTVWDQTSGGGVASAPATKAVTTSFTLAPAPTATASANSTGGFIGVTWTTPSPTGSQPAVSYVDLFRREASGTFIRVATPLPASGTYPDYAVASGVAYEYKATAVGTNATTRDSNVVSAGVVFTAGVWLHDPLDPVATAHFFEYREVNLSDTPKLPSGDFHFVGRDYPTRNFDGKAITRDLKLRVALIDGTNDKTALEKLFYSRNTLCFRDFKGRKVFCSVNELPGNDEKWGAWVDLNFMAVSYSEVMG